MTSLLPAEFGELLADSAPAWARYHRCHALDGELRPFPAHRERANALLAGSDLKLFFLLTCRKSNALQQHQAASFGVSQTRVSRLAGVLLAVLNRVLDQWARLPARDGAQVAQRLAARPAKVFACDGVERGILRNADPDGQKEADSAKRSLSPKKQCLVRRSAVPALPLTDRIRAAAW